MQEQEVIRNQDPETGENRETDTFVSEPEKIKYFTLSDPDEPPTAVQTLPVEPAEDELFYKYEIKAWEFSPRFYKILAASAIFNVLALAVFGQFDLLQMKACDSPLVGKFCQVIDTVYVGSKILGTDSEFVDKPYERSELDDADIVWLDRTGDAPPLSYPEGYFALANPEQFVITDIANPNGDYPVIPGVNPRTPNIIPSNPNSGVLNQPQVLPNPNDNAIPNDLPASVGGTNPTIPGRRNPRNKNPKIKPTTPADPNSEDKTKTDKKTDETVAENNKDVITEVELNKRPLIDLGKYVSELQKKDAVNLATPFIVQAKGKLNKAGRIDKASYQIIKADSTDEDMIAVVKRSIEAINESGYLQYLEKLSGKDLSLLFKQDEENITAEIESVVESENRAKSIKSTLDLAISLVKMKKTGEDASQNDKDDLELLNGAKIETDGKKLIIKFTVKKDIAQPMIQRKLLIPKEDEKAKQNSAAKTTETNKQSGR